MPNQYLPGVNTTPNSLIITDITRSYPMIVTTTLVNTAPNPRVNTYKIGMNMRLYVPKPYGMYQANGLVGTILSISDNEFMLNIDSTLFDTFVIPVTTVESPPSLSPYGSKNLEYDNSTNEVPFQSLNNIGN
jgi:hypothetical protein